MIDDQAQEVVRHAAVHIGRGEPEHAANILMAAWAVCLLGPGPGPLVQGGATLCAGALKRRLGLSVPADAEAFFAMRLSTVDGHVVSFEEATKDPAELAALRCVGASLNDDADLVSSVLGAYIGQHGAGRTLDIVAELVNYYVAFEDTEVWRHG